MQLKDKVALITGAASGIGKEMAIEYAKQGAKVVIADLNDDLGAQLAEELGGASVHTMRSSIADRAYENDLEALLQMRRLMDFLRQ